MSPMAPMSSSSNTMQLNVVETARKYEALVAATFEGNAAGSSRMATHDEVRIETNALFHVPDLRKLFERVHGPLVIRESSAVKGGRATRQPLRFGVYGPATNPECPGDNDAAQDDHDDHGDQDDHCDDQDDLGQAHEPQYQEDTQQHEQYEREETQQHQVQLPAADADSDEPVDDRPISNDAMSEIEVKTNGKSDKIDDAIVSDIEVKAKCDDDYGDEMSGKKSMTGRFLVFAFAFAFAFALVLVMREIVVIGTTATTCLASVLRWLVFTIVWWIMAVLVPGAVALVVAIVAVISVITGVAFLVLAVANRACTMCIIPLTLAVFHGGVRGGKWCWRTSCQLWGACSATKTVMESSSPSMSESKSKHTSEHKSKKDEGFETATGSETGSEMNRTETRNNVLVHADLAQLFPLSPPATALGTGSASASASASETDSNSESDHERETETETEEETETETEPEMETETEVPVQEVMRSSPPSDQHAAMGLGLIDTVDRSTLSLSVFWSLWSLRQCGCCRSRRRGRGRGFSPARLTAWSRRLCHCFCCCYRYAFGCSCCIFGGVDPPPPHLPEGKAYQPRSTVRKERGLCLSQVRDAVVIVRAQSRWSAGRVQGVGNAFADAGACAVSRPSNSGFERLALEGARTRACTRTRSRPLEHDATVWRVVVGSADIDLQSIYSVGPTGLVIFITSYANDTYFDIPQEASLGKLVI